MLVNTLSFICSDPTAVMTVRLLTDTTNAVPSTSTRASREPLPAARPTPSESRPSVAESSSIPRRCTRASAWRENCSGWEPPACWSAPAKDWPGGLAPPFALPEASSAGLVGPGAVGATVGVAEAARATGGVTAAPRGVGGVLNPPGGINAGFEIGFIWADPFEIGSFDFADARDLYARDAFNREGRAGTGGLDAFDLSGRRGAGGGIAVADAVSDQLDRTRELAGAREVGCLLELGELRQLGHVFVAVGRFQGILCLQLSDHQLQEVVLAEHTVRVFGVRCRRGVAGRGGGLCHWRCHGFLSFRSLAGRPAVCRGDGSVTRARR